MRYSAVMRFRVMPVFLLLSLLGRSTFADSDPCADALTLLHSIHAFRQEILSMREQYIRTHDAITPRGSSTGLYSQTIGPETALIPVRAMEDSHVIYFASGPDVIRPIYDFPWASTYHYADFFLGWGNNPYVALAELLARIRDVFAKNELKWVQKGFLADFETDPELFENKNRFWKEVLRSSTPAAPAILKARWISPALGPIEKTFYIHATNMRRGPDVRNMLSHLPPGKSISGVLTIGMEPRMDLTHLYVVPRMKSGAAYVRHKAQTPLEHIGAALLNQQCTVLRSSLAQDAENHKSVYTSPYVTRPWWHEHAIVCVKN